jgi:hypothetical protein
MWASTTVPLLDDVAALDLAGRSGHRKGEVLFPRPDS